MRNQCSRTAVQIAAGYLQERRIPIVHVSFKSAHPIIDIVDFENSAECVWTCYAWGRDTRGRWEKWTAPMGGCQLRRTRRMFPPTGSYLFTAPRISE